MTLESLYRDLVAFGTEHKSKEDWLEHRMSGLGGTDTSALFEQNPWTTAMNVYMTKTTGIDNFVPNGETRKGKQLEPLVGDLYRERTRYIVPDLSDDISFASLSQPFTMGTIDRIALTPEGLRVVELKTADGKGAFKWQMGIPMAYQIQLKKYIGIVREIINFIYPDYINNYAPIVGDMAVLIGYDLSIYPDIECTKGEERAIWSADKDFWINHIVPFEPPTPKFLSECKTLWGDCSEEEAAIEATEQVLDAIIMRERARLRCVEVKQEHRAVESRYTALQNKCETQILKYIQENEIITHNDIPIFTWKPNKNGTRVMRINRKYLYHIRNVPDQEYDGD